MALRVVREHPDPASSGIRIEAGNGHWFVAVDEVDAVVRALTDAAERADEGISTPAQVVGNWFSAGSVPPHVLVCLAFSEQEFMRGKLGISRREFDEGRAAGTCRLTGVQARALAGYLAEAKSLSVDESAASTRAWPTIETVHATE